MTINIYFIENSFVFNAKHLNSPQISGSEKTLINTVNELAKNSNFKVTVFNNTSEEVIINNVSWFSLKSVKNHNEPDILIAMSDANLLSLFSSKKKYLWSHSVQTIEKFIRKKQLFAFLKNKPKVILESNYHFNKRSLFTAPFGKEILKLAPDTDFINTKINHNFIPKKNAIFPTRADRNLNFLLDCWKSIYEKSPDSRLFINPPYNLSNDEIKTGIFLRNKVIKGKLINDLINSKVVLLPGHKGEVFCLAAEEARELCIPIVTMGYGSLSERVEHLKTGYIANSKKDFIKFAIDILNDDNIYLSFKKNLLTRRGNRKYSNVVSDLIKILNI